jgi:L-aspartate oxidase
LPPNRIDDPCACRYLVLGTGIAGLQFALLAARHGDVRIVTKKNPDDSNTNHAQGGIAAVLSPLDEFELHVRDTLVAGDGLCREEIVRRMVEAGPRLIERLLSHGAEFSREGEGPQAAFALGREGGHSQRRILHAQDLTGRMLESALLKACRAEPRITIEEDHLAVELIRAEDLPPAMSPGDRVAGCWVLDRRTQSRRPYLADAVVIATGGCGKVYSYTSNPDIATGDGLAMAYRAGARLANLEFVQFHPTCLYHPEAKSFLISEAVRGEGAYLINERGERFMSRYHKLAELAPRDIVARSIDQELKISGAACVFLDLRHLDRAAVEARFPYLAATCRQFGIDFAGQPVPVVPAAHYMCGGIVVDQQARATLPGLYAVGEAACTGAHGANRLASNSLLEAVYLAEAAAEAAADEPAGRWPAPANNDPLGRTGPEPAVMVLEHDWDSVRRVMWDYVGIVRDDARLDIALSRLRNIRRTVERQYASCQVTPALVELRNLALLGELIVLCARGRRESRGLHYTLDQPHKDDGPPRDTVIGLDSPVQGEVAWALPVSKQEHP